MPYYVIAVISSCYVLMHQDTAHASENLPCSERYKKVVSYELMTDDIGRNPDHILSRWVTPKKPWGEERLSVVRNSRSKEPAMAFFFPKGSINPSNESAPKGGAVLYITGGFVPKAEAACLQYRVYFPEDFEFGKGGKLPGLYGGSDDKGNSASGCRKNVENAGFSTRYMWRENGAGSVYAYLPEKEEKCGKYIGKASWFFTAGTWSTLEQEVILNQPGKDNGIIRVWVDGNNVINQIGLTLRLKPEIVIDGIFFTSFFGGKQPDWASPRDQTIEITGLKVFFP